MAETTRPASLPLFSQIGRSAEHIWSTLSQGKSRARRTAAEPLEQPDLEKETALMKKLKEDQKHSELHRKPKLTQAFRAISRAKRDDVTRNRTEPPVLGHYNPNWKAVKPRTVLGPKYITETTTPRNQVIFLPTCLEGDISHMYPRVNKSRSSSPVKDETQDQISLNRSTLDDSLHRTKRDFKDFEEQLSTVNSKWRPVPEVPQVKLKSAIDFHIQVSRKPFVKESDPPNANRFSFMEPHSLTLSSNHKPAQVDFSKVTKRPEVFPINDTPAFYDGNKEVTKPRLSRFIMAFDKRTDRKDNLNFHTLSTPRSPEWSSLERSLNSTMKTPHNLPKMGTTTPRDDSMYRVTETYLMNVPEKQLADDIPQFGGSPRRGIRTGH